MSSETTKKSKPVRAVVTSAKMNKSRVAVSERLVKHPMYAKYMRRTTKVMFHDEKNLSQEGDTVLLAQAAPKSARKRFTLLEIVTKAVK